MHAYNNCNNPCFARGSSGALSCSSRNFQISHSAGSDACRWLYNTCRAVAARQPGARWHRWTEVCTGAPPNLRIGCVCEVLLQVEIVVRSPVPSARAEIVQLSEGLRLTSWHPVWIGGEWQFPHQCGPAQMVQCDEVFNFVLSDEHVMWLGDVACCTLGHGMQGNVIGHPFLGNLHRVWQDLAALPGFESGLVDVVGIRCQNSGMLCKFESPSIST